MARSSKRDQSWVSGLFVYSPDLLRENCHKEILDRLSSPPPSGGDLEKREHVLLGRDHQQDPAQARPAGLGCRLVQQGQANRKKFNPFHST